MKAYIENLNEREKWMVITAILCIFVYAYYFFAYAPLKKQVLLKSEQLIEKNNTLLWMKALPKYHPNDKATFLKVDNSQLIALIAKQLKTSSISKFSYQLQQTTSGDIQLSFETVPYNTYIEWLVRINQNYSIVVKQFNSEKQAKPGFIHTTLLLGSN